MTTQPKTILYVDDDADDCEFLANAIKDADPEVEVILAENGLKALDYLHELKSKANDLPCLIVLDINMPYLDGKETFNELKKDSTLHDVPVIVFSSSEKPNDKTLFNSLGIEYIVKPSDIKYMNDIASRMVRFCCH
jgi:DNA-binding response OmpR family regulator